MTFQKLYDIIIISPEKPFMFLGQKRGSVAEWFKAHAWKACVRFSRTGGSNPLASATKCKRGPGGAFFVLGGFRFFY